MSDILDELKAMAAFTDRVYGGRYIQHRAIDEIERLRAEVERLKRALQYIVRRGYTGASFVAQRALNGEEVSDA